MIGVVGSRWCRHLLGVIGLVLIGCSGSQQDELQAWMQAERNSIRPDVKPIPAPTQFVPYAYGGQGLVEPFSGERLASILRAGQVTVGAKSALIEAEMQRRKQPLEAFPLDVMSMVGSLNKKGELVALVKVDQLLYQVSPGGYLGQNYGRVTKISENEIVLREVVQDAAGDWVERPAVLRLQEEASK